MKKASIVLLSTLLALPQIAKSEQLYPYSQLLAPIQVRFAGDGIYRSEIYVYNNSTQSTLQSHPVDITITKVTGISANGNLCKMKISSFVDGKPLNKLSFDKYKPNYTSYVDISEDGCYPEMVGAVIETEEVGTWRFNKKDSKYLIPETDTLTPNPNADPISISIDESNSTLTVKSNIEKVSIYPIKGSGEVLGSKGNSRIGSVNLCKIYLPNTNRQGARTLALGESITYHTEKCDFNEVKFEVNDYSPKKPDGEQTIADRLKGYFNRYHGKIMNGIQM